MAAAQPVAATDSDQYIANTELLLKGEGTNGQTNSTFVDSSASNHSITPYNDVTQGSFSPFSPKGWSGYFDGSNDYLELTSTSNLKPSGTFTVECWFKTPDNTHKSNTYGARLISGGDSSGNHFGVFFNSSDGRIGFFFQGSYDYHQTTPTENVWHHVAYVRDSSNVIKIYLDGVPSTNTITNSSATAYGNNFFIGRNGDGFITNEGLFKGEISNFRFVNGTCLYTTSFTPPTEPLTAVTNTKLLTLQDNRFIDNSASNHSITVNGGTAIKPTSPFSGDRTYPKASYFSGKFDGSNDYLDCGSNSDFAFGTGDFTVEGWFNATDLSSGAGLVYIGGNASSYAGVRVGISSNQLYLLMSTTGTSWQIQTGLIGNTISTGSWYHFAVTRNSTTVRVFLNGTQIASPSLSGSLYFGTQNRFGYSNTEYLNGYLSNLRIVKGTCLYTTTFTPPTAPLTPVANTKLLTLQDNYLVDHSPSGHSITNNGGVTLEPESPFSNSTYPLSGPFYSGYFDGSNDKLTFSSSTDFSLLNDFTFEAWVYRTSDPNPYSRIANWGDYWGNNTAVSLLFDDGASPDKVAFRSYSGITLTSSSSVYSNQWYHVAVTRSNNDYKLFINGALEASTTSSTAIISSSSTIFCIGSAHNRDVEEPFAGYISNARFVKGTALYTSDFTVPTEPLTAVSGTTLLTLQDATIQDNSASNHSITNNGVTVTEIAPFGAALIDRAGSMYFDGSGDYLEIPYSSEHTFGTGDFTIECWIYRQQPLSSLNTGIAGIWSGTLPAVQAWLWYVDASNQLRFINNHPTNEPGDDQIFTSPATIGFNQWYHIAVTRNGNVWKTFVDGTQAAINSNYSPGMRAGSNPLVIGHISQNTSNEVPFKGFISDFRITKGTALYTSNFTPPTAPLQPITNTKLLLSGNNGGVEDSLGKRTFETDGNAQIDTTVKKFGSGAIEFDGNGDYLKGTGFDLSGKYTIEGWVYRRAQSGYQKIFGQCGSTWDWSSTGVHVSFYFDQITNYLRYEIPYGQNVSPYVYAIATTSAPAADTWHYFAAICDGTNTSLFLNGIRVGTTPNIIPWTNGLETECSIGGNGGMSASGTPSAHFNGFLDDFRVTVGVARYDPTQTSHTVPTKTHPTV